MWDAPAPAKREPNSKTKPAATVTGRSEPQDAEMSDKPERERSRSPKGQGGPGNTESCDQPELDIPTPMPPSDLFEAVERGGGGDCAFLSIAQCLAAAGNKPTAADLAPGGKLQAYLRCKASKYMREHASDFSHISEASTLTDEIAKPGTWANSVSLTALALELKLQLRIWAWDKALRKWNRGTFISLVRPRLDPPKKKGKKANGDAVPIQTDVVWLRLHDFHYQWLRPRGADKVLNKALSTEARAVQLSEHSQPWLVPALPLSLLHLLALSYLASGVAEPPPLPPTALGVRRHCSDSSGQLSPRLRLAGISASASPLLLTLRLPCLVSKPRLRMVFQAPPLLPRPT